MAEWVAPISLTAASGLLGWLLLRVLAARWGLLQADGLEIGMVGLLLGTAVIGWVAFVLAETGFFSLGLMALLWLVMVMALSWRAWTTRAMFRRESPLSLHHRGSLAVWERPLLALWLLAALWLFFRPHEYILGGADAGVYVSLSAHIAQSGQIIVQNELLASMSEAARSIILRPIDYASVSNAYWQPAFYVIGPPGKIMPQFYHLHPVWQALAYTLGGIKAALLMPGLWALFGSAVFYLMVRTLTRWEVAILGIGGLSINALQVWFARYPTTETLTQFVLWAGLWALIQWQRGRQPARLWALLAGVHLGILFLVRIDMFFVLGFVGLWLLWLWLAKRWSAAAWWFTIPFALLVIHSLVHGFWQSRPYLYNLFEFGFRLLTGNPILLALVFLISGLGLIILVRFGSRLEKLRRWQRPLLITTIIVIIVLAGYAWFIRPVVGAGSFWLDSYSTTSIPLSNHENMVRLGWYLSPVGLALGIIGICLMVWRVNRETAVLLGINLFFAAFYLWNIRANPHQIYAMRRFVPSVMPFFVLAGTVALDWLWQKQAVWHRATAVFLAIVWLAGYGWSARGFISQVDFHGLTDQVAAISNQLEPESIIFFNDNMPVGFGDFLATPLHFLFGHSIFKVYDQGGNGRALAETIQNLHNNGLTIYWAGDPGWLDAHGISYSQTTEININQTALENSYERKPIMLQPYHWQFPIYRLQ